MKKKYIILFVFILIIISLVLFQKDIMKFIYKIDYSEFVEKYASAYNVDKYLVYAVIKNESNFNSKATSNKEAKGLMQIISSTGDEIANKLNVENELYDEETNIQLGVFYLSELLDKYDKYTLAVAAYNAGIGNVDSWLQNAVLKDDGSDIENIPYKETNNYVRKVSRDYRIYEYLYE